MFQKALRCAAVCLAGVASAHAADGVITAAALPSATWQQALRYVIHWLPACKEYPQFTAVISVRGTRLMLYYGDLNYGTTDSLPLDKSLSAEARSNDGSWRLFVRYRRTVVTSDAPQLQGHSVTDVFFCDGDRATTQGLAAAFTRLNELHRQQLDESPAEGG